MERFSQVVDQGNVEEISQIVDQVNVEDFSQLVDYDVEERTGSICECF